MQTALSDRLFWRLNWLRVGDGTPKSVEEMFEGRHFSAEVIILCVRWYLRFKLSPRDLVEMMAERGLSVAHTTIMRWVQRYAPEFEKRWKRFAQAVGQSWRVDEMGYPGLTQPLPIGGGAEECKLEAGNRLSTLDLSFWRKTPFSTPGWTYL